MDDEKENILNILHSLLQDLPTEVKWKRVGIWISFIFQVSLFLGEESKTSEVKWSSQWVKEIKKETKRPQEPSFPSCHINNRFDSRAKKKQTVIFTYKRKEKKPREGIYFPASTSSTSSSSRTLLTSHFVLSLRCSDIKYLLSSLSWFTCKIPAKIVFHKQTCSSTRK